MNSPQPINRADPVQEPVRHVTRDGVNYTILGTAHVSRASAEAVAEMLAEERFDTVAIELCQARYNALTDKNAWRNLDLFQLIRDGKAGMMMASLALGAYQRRIAEQFGIEPGAEMKAAIAGAGKKGLPLQLIDREIGITLKRTSRGLSWWRRYLLTSGIIASLFSRDEVSEESIERLKEGDMLNEVFSEFAESAPQLYEPLIAERDRFMAARLRYENSNASGRNVLVVIGAGHMDGLVKALEQNKAAPADEIGELNHIPSPRRWVKIIPWLILALVLTGFYLGFRRGADLGWSLVITWVVFNGGLAGLGALLARAHPVTILSAVVTAPVTSLNPTIHVGMITSLVECWIRKPRVTDFETLRDDVAKISGWWHNRVSRVLLVLFFTVLGSAVGTWVAGIKIFSRLT